MRRHGMVGPALAGVGVALGMAPELEVVLERQEHADAVAAVDWGAYRSCGTCRRAMGMPCVARSGRVVDGRPDGVETELEQPHAHRKRRVGR